MKKIGICDDEPVVHKQVKECIMGENWGEEIEVLSFFSGKDLLGYEGYIDILLLDIVMPEMDGIAVGHMLNKDKRVGKIIMLTGMRERFKEAFEIEAYRFVTKPIVEEELVRAVGDAMRSFIGYSLVEVYHRNKKYYFQQKEIFYISKVQSRTEIVIGKNIFTSPLTLENWQRILDERLFFLVHKSYLVNMSQIDKIDGYKLYLGDEEIVPLAKRKRKLFMQAYMRYDLDFR